MVAVVAVVSVVAVAVGSVAVVTVGSVVVVAVVSVVVTGGGGTLAVAVAAAGAPYGELPEPQALGGDVGVLGARVEVADRARSRLEQAVPPGRLLKAAIGVRRGRGGS